MDLARTLAAALPDQPLWLETRAMLLSGHAEIADAAPAGFTVRVQHGALSAAAVVGRPPCGAIRGAVEGTTELTPIIVQAPDADHVAACLRDENPEWRHEPAIVHLQRDRPPRPDPPRQTTVRLLDPADDLGHLPPGLRHEITHARELRPVAAVFEGSAAISFCYPVWTTETLWDVSVDTLEGHRGRRHAVHPFWAMADLMRAQGREPVWGALASNSPSLRLAARLGFSAVGRIAVFSRGGWVFMSGGFTE